MQFPPDKPSADIRGLPDITFRQLEVFRAVWNERSYANAALELRSTRANVKRVCDDFGEAVGRPLFEEDEGRNLVPSAFANGLVAELGPLSRSLRRMDEGIRSLHAAGRVVRFAAAGEFFRGGLFTEYLGKLQIKDTFLPCFLRIDMKRFRTAVLNNECDIYFGVGLTDCERLDVIDLGPVPWKIAGPEGVAEPREFRHLTRGKWGIVSYGGTEATEALLETFHQSGAAGGRVLDQDEEAAATKKGFVFKVDTGTRDEAGGYVPPWPCHRFSAVLRKHHPYSELKSRLADASIS
jgi:DNA-binding transcriptional LysR family regulator